MAPHFSRVEDAAPTGKAAGPLLRPIRTGGRPEDHEAFLALRQNGFKALRKALDKRTKKR